jgi:diguanylate cyclase (GGDEF)-like protein/PAS domain S-box-containing protein
MQTPTRSFFQVLIRSVALRILIIGVVVLSGTLWFAIAKTQDAAKHDLMRSLDRSAERLRMLIQAAELTATSVERIAKTSDLSTEQALYAALEKSLAAFEQRPELSYLGIVLDTHGEYGNLERTPEGNVLLWMHPGVQPDEAATRNYLLTADGFRFNAQQPPAGYDARQRPFYQAALRKPAEGRWLAAYPWIVHTSDSESLWGLSYVQALHDRQGQLLGVLDIDLDLPALNRFLGAIATEYDVQLHIVEQSATPRLIGGPDVTAQPIAVPEAITPLLVARDAPDVQQAALTQTDHWVATHTITLRGDLAWTLVASRPVQWMDGALRTQLYQMAGMAIAMALGLMLVAAQMARRIGLPLAELEQSVEHAGEQGTADALVLAPSSRQYTETAHLGDALVRMATAIQLRETQLASQTVELLQAKEAQVAALTLKGAMFDATSTAIFSLDDNQQVIEWNAGAERLFGHHRSQVLQRPIAEVLVTPTGPADWQDITAAQDVCMHPLTGAAGPFDAEIRTVVTQQHGQQIHTLIINDVSERQHARRQLLQERDYGDAVINSLPGVFYHCDEHARLQRWNQNLEDMTQLSADQLAGIALTTLMPADEQKHAAEKIAEVLTSGEAHFEANYELPNGQRVPCLFTGVRFDHDGTSGFVGLGTDISARKQSERQLRHLATHDALTNLPNRHLLQEQLAQLIAQATPEAPTIAVLLLDLDHFKIVNDAYGHAFGDEVIKAVSMRLVRVLPEGHTVARHGGDEFLIILGHLHNRQEVQQIATRLLTCLRQPLALQGRDIHLSASIGISVFPQDGHDTETLIKNADQAMYQAKHLGRNTYVSFDVTMAEQMQERINLETQLRLAVASNQFHLVYQPKMSLQSGAIIGCEALLRWQHPQLGMISPARFIPVAEECGLITPISDWVLRTACTQAKAWVDEGLPRTPVAVNISAGQLLQQSLSVWALDMLEETGLAPELLELELTETLIAKDVERMIAEFDTLKAAGVKLSIDDFGTGYSSLSYLRNFRVDTLKIDQSFVKNMLDRPDDDTIVRAVITLAHNLRLKVIAEGVETEAHCRILRAHHCDEIQGYYFSKPVSAEAFTALLKSGHKLRLTDPPHDAHAGA